MLLAESKTSLEQLKSKNSRQLLESIVIEFNSKMPLAQNYKDDVSLLESEAALSRAKGPSINNEFSTNQGINVSVL